MFAVIIRVNGETVDAAADLAAPFIEHMRAQTFTDGEVQFNEDGTSTGGVFDAMPAKDSDLAADLPLVEDSGILDSADGL